MGFFSRLAQTVNEKFDKAFDAGHDAIHAAGGKIDGQFEKAFDAGHDAIHEGVARVEAGAASSLTKGAQSLRASAVSEHEIATVHNVSKPLPTPSIAAVKNHKLREI